jgi:hypothetical protein
MDPNWASSLDHIAELVGEGCEISVESDAIRFDHYDIEIVRLTEHAAKQHLDDIVFAPLGSG